MWTSQNKIKINPVACSSGPVQLKEHQPGSSLSLANKEEQFSRELFGIVVAAPLNVSVYVACLIKTCSAMQKQHYEALCGVRNPLLIDRFDQTEIIT